jgi:glycine/D-amino acid oxidase-like deaminating enzyme
MGRCQGRYCTPHLAALVAHSDRLEFAPQLPLRPVPLAALAVEKPEWKGHKRSLLPERKSSSKEPLPVQAAATVIIGAGIVGLWTALFLARAGHEVVIVDSGFPNGGASGGNAGSLHAQLLSFDYGWKAESGGGPAAKTLPLQAESILLWQRLATEFEVDPEITITGGVMVAENERDLSLLAAKTALERANGIDCEVIGAGELRRLEPNLSRRFLGAAFCPLEGKINPLTATDSVLQEARRAGAIMLTQTAVRGIDRDRSGFVVQTSRGSFRSGRVVNAAGAFAGTIGEMLGARIPVYGAPLQMAVTEAAEPLVSRLVSHADRHLTLKQAANGNLIIGGGWPAGLDPVHGYPRPFRESLEGNLWIAQHVLPALRKLHLIRSWAAMNINIDGAPILGEYPGLPGFFNAVTSNGYTLGPIMGQTCAELVLRGHADRDISAFTVERFQN